MSKTFVLPDLGEGIHEAQIIRVMIKPGDSVVEDQPLMEVETDKAAVEIPSPYGGKIENVHVKEGQTVTVGDTIVTYSGVDGAAAAAKKGGDEAASDKKAEAEKEPKAARAKDRIAEAATIAPVSGMEAPATTSGPPQAGRSKASAAPAVRKMARDMGVDLAAVQGSGPGGRITREDLERHAAGGGAGSATAQKLAAPSGGVPTPTPSALAPPASVAPAVSRVAPMPTQPPPGEVGADKWGTIRTWPLSQIRKTIANQMKTSAFTIPHVTHGDEADVTELERTRKRLNDATGGNPKLTIMAMVMRAVCVALRKFPIFNAVFDGEHNAIIYKDYVNLGAAVDTDRGLVVPNVRNADTLSVIGLAQALQAIAESARTGQFAIDDLRGGTFTITNVGPLGGTFATPIINHPEVAILGLGRTRKVPVFDENDNVKPALVMPVFVSFDHRAADGLAAAKFTREIVGLLEQPDLMLLY